MPNSVEIQPIRNSVELSLFDVYTHEYFLSGAQILEEHEEAGDSG
jgi:hypothetical protein